MDSRISVKLSSNYYARREIMEQTKAVNELEAQMNQLIANLGKLSKQFLINSDYKKRRFVSNSLWKNQLKLLQSQLEMLMAYSSTTTSASIELALQKYAKRKKLQDDKILKMNEYSSESEFLQAALRYSYDLFGVGSIEGDLLDLVSEICEFHEEFHSQSPFRFSANWYNELADIAYLLLRLQKHPAMQE
jgi:hypothetical protein